ncbi:MAG TPA: hypothetical protein DER07_04400 [Armatimonadetes bacterium]|nr:hypothetical protein [Armatimonadota bacterium]
MNRTLRYALGVVLGAAVALPAMAQDNFPDVPENHWAYEALANMKRDGLLVGYPDGLFRGGRPASRYELAVAIHATYQKLKGMYDGLSGQIDSLTSALDGKADKADLQSLRDALNALKADLDGMKAWGDDIANLKKLASTFEKELASMGVDVEAMKKDLGDLQDRVEKLEKRKPAVDIHGTVDLFTLNGYSDDDKFGLTVDGRPVGVGRGAYEGAPVGVTRDFTVLHEGALTFSGTNEEGPQWKATLVTGNTLGTSALGDQANGGSGAFLEGDQTIYLYDFSVKFDTSLAGQAFTAEIGRIGYQTTPLLFKRQDRTPYFESERWDNGNWMFDGANLAFGFGPAKLNAFAGRVSDKVASNGEKIQPMLIGTPDGSFEIDQMLGLNLNVPVAQKAGLNLAYIWLDSNRSDWSYSSYETAPSFNRVVVWGGDLKVDLSPITVELGYGRTDVMYNEDSVNDEDNTAWYGKLGYDAGKWGATVGYKEVEAYYLAPGDWGRVGWIYNPTGLEGFDAKLWFNLSDALSLKATGEWYEGKSVSTFLPENDELNRYTAELGYKLNTSWDLTLGWEYVEYKPEFGDNLKANWYSLGLKYAFNDKAKLSILWQMSDVDRNMFDGEGSPEYKGGLIATQLSVKF